MTVAASNTVSMTSPRSTREVKQQLAELAKVKQSAQAHGVNDFASRMAMQSILGHEQSLLEELRAAEMLESGSDLELVLDGDPVHDHMIQANFLGMFLSKTQQLVNAIAQAVTSVPTARASVQRNIVAENRLMVTGWMPSSFAIRLRLPTQEELHQLFEPASQTVLDTLAEALGEKIPSERTKELITFPRVKKHYYELLETMAKQGSVLRMRTRRLPYGIRIDARQARDLVEWLDVLQIQEQPLTLDGILVGGNIESARFELKASDGEMYRGKTSEIAKEQMKQITFGAKVSAQLRVTTMIHEEGAMEPSTSYFLDSVQQGS